MPKNIGVTTNVYLASLAKLVKEVSDAIEVDNVLNKYNKELLEMVTKAYFASDAGLINNFLKS